MTKFHYHDRQLYTEDVPVADIAAQFGTPTYIYSRQILEQQFLAYQESLKNHPHLICYAVKANSNLAVLNLSLIHI